MISDSGSTGADVIFDYDGRVSLAGYRIVRDALGNELPPLIA